MTTTSFKPEQINQSPTSLESGGANGHIRLSEVISSISFALDLTEGQPEGHAVRSCLIGMRIAKLLGFDDDDLASLFYALLLKDLGCSSNAAKMCWLFAADDRVVKKNFKLIDWSNFLSGAKFALNNVLPGSHFLSRFAKVVGLATQREEMTADLIRVRCERGANITRMLGFDEYTAQSILSLDEHWDGNGHPQGVRGDQIHRGARICCLAQTMEVFNSQFGMEKACEIAVRRSGTWFDPEMVKAFLSLATNKQFLQSLHSPNPIDQLTNLEPADFKREVDGEMLDRIAVAFAQVIDAKSPWTHRHSDGVAQVAVELAKVLGRSEVDAREIKRAGLLHDIGKLGVSNIILDKPEKLTPDEFEEMKRHSLYTQQILERISSFQRFADYASAHHERMDGRGYHRSLEADKLSMEARILAVADVVEALSSDRPYRKGMPVEQVIDIITSEAGVAFCPEVVRALLIVQNNTNIIERLKARS